MHNGRTNAPFIPRLPHDAKKTYETVSAVAPFTVRFVLDFGVSGLCVRNKIIVRFECVGNSHHLQNQIQFQTIIQMHCYRIRTRTI